jgi:prenyltransferase beta subunit
MGQSQDDLMYHLTSHLRLNAVYWGLTALCVMKHKEALDRDELIEFVMSCWDEKAGTCSRDISLKSVINMFDALLPYICD